MMTGRRFLRGAEMVEAAIVVPVTIVLTVGLVLLGFALFERSVVDSRLSTLGSELPDGWSTMSAEQVVRDLVLDGSGLDPERLEVSRATLRESSESSDVQGDPVAVALDADVRHEESRWVEVEGKVSYEFDGLGIPFGTVTFERTVRGTYLAERRWEVS